MIQTKPQSQQVIKQKIQPFSEDHVKDRIPSIRKEIFKLMKLVKHHKKKNNEEKTTIIQKKIITLRRERIKILNNLPDSLKAMATIHDINITGFEESITTKTKTILISGTNTFRHAAKPLRCLAFTLKGSQCTRKANTPCGKFCRRHKPR